MTRTMTISIILLTDDNDDYDDDDDIKVIYFPTTSHVASCRIVICQKYLDVKGCRSTLEILLITVNLFHIQPDIIFEKYFSIYSNHIKTMYRFFVFFVFFNECSKLNIAMKDFCIIS